MKRARPCLFLVSSPQEAWDDAIAPWFEQVSPAWRRALPSLVVVPTRGQASDLKARLIAKGTSHLGLHFVTPNGLRALLARDEATPLARPEQLRLLLAIAAGEMEKRPNEQEALAARAVARTPGPFLRTLDRLESAGWKFDEVGLPSFAPTVQRFHELLEQCDLTLPAQADRQRLQQARHVEPKFSQLLITGFDGAHWPHWFLLRTTAALAENVTVVLHEPGADFSDVDLCWIGSWEEVCGEAKRTTRPSRTTDDALFSEAEMRGQTQSVRNTRFDFLVGTNASEQAQAIARQCVRYLAAENCSRLGVIFPGGGALSRLVANALSQSGISHNDGLAHLVPGIFESGQWQAWLALQRAPRLQSFLNFLNALPDSAALSPKINRHNFEKVLLESYKEVLLDDLEVLREFCATRTDEKHQAVAEALLALPFLPARATLVQFLGQTLAALTLLGWRQPALEIENVTRVWPQRLAVEFSRALFLRWLEETALSFGAARSPEGDHPYACVQLLTVAQAQNQQWSHLIFGGWNEGAWPPAATGEFAREEEIRAFNRSVQQLNKRAARQGSQGEGHTSVRENHALYPGPAEQRAIALRQFDALLESATESVTLAASLLQEDAPERFWNPSECFTRLYYKTRGELLTQATLKKLQRATALLPTAAPSKLDVEQTLTAFKARRDTSKAAGEYDFALRPNDSYRPTPILSVSDLEQMVSSPAMVWMKRYLGVEAAEDTSNPWAATSGKWVHHWLASIGETENGKIFAVFPSPEKIDQRVQISADKRRTRLEHFCASLGKTVPDWWISGWLNARYLARHLGAKMAGAEGWKWMAAEFPIGREGEVKVADNISLQLRGRIDLILSPTEMSSFAGQTIWIVDYKTNSTKELKDSDLHDKLVKGDTLQLGLYALAVRELGAAQVGASFISAAVRNVVPQLPVTALDQHTNVFADLMEMQRTGIFGMKGEIRPPFGYSAPYPLATLPIDNDVLEDKWALTHPNLVLEKEEWEIW